MNEGMWLNFAGYVLGVAVHVGSKWTDSYQASGSWQTFGRTQAGATVRNGIAALILFGVWQTGALTSALGALGGTEVQLPLNFATSTFAGYVMDSMAKNLIPAPKPDAPGN